jgi:hypothetical protein
MWIWACIEGLKNEINRYVDDVVDNHVDKYIKCSIDKA